MSNFYRPKRSFGQGNIFTPVCHSVHRGGSGKETPNGWMEEPPPPPLDGEPPPGWRTPLGWRNPPPQLDGGTPPDGEPPPGKRTPAYGLRSAGTHPTGMHSCYQFFFQIFPTEHRFPEGFSQILAQMGTYLLSIILLKEYCDARSVIHKCLISKFIFRVYYSRKTFYHYIAISTCPKWPLLP